MAGHNEDFDLRRNGPSVCQCGVSEIPPKALNIPDGGGATLPNAAAEYRRQRSRFASSDFAADENPNRRRLPSTVKARPKQLITSAPSVKNLKIKLGHFVGNDGTEATFVDERQIGEKICDRRKPRKPHK
jgi:hypothetical protein